MRTSRGARVAGALALALWAGSVPGQSNVVVNGGFESGLASWSTTGFFAQGFDFGIDSTAHTGSSAFFGGAIESPGFLSQSIPTSVGATYDLSFWVASDGFLPNQFRVVVNGQTLLTRDDILLQPYSTFHTSFIATSPSSQLQFGFRNDSGSLHLDDVSVAVIPEPEVSLLMAIGLGALALVRRRRAASSPSSSGMRGT